MTVKKQKIRSGINIEHGQYEEQATSHIRNNMISNAVNVATAIDKVRKIAHINCKSPAKNDTLQSYAKSKNLKSIHLLHDCKRRCNILVAMLERYLDLKYPVEKTLIDYKINNPLSESEYVALSPIVHVLKPIQLGSEKRCSQEVTLLRAKGVVSFIIEEPYEQNSASSLKLKEALIVSRLNERIKKTLISLIKYIKNGKMHSTESLSSGHIDTSLEALPAKSVLLSAAKDFLFTFMMKAVTKCLFYPIPKECLILSQLTQIKAEQQCHSRN